MYQNIEGAKLIPIGSTPAIEDYEKTGIKKYDWCFLGQVANNNHRKEMVKQVKDVPGGFLLATDGFAQGLDQKEYYKIIEQSKVVLCPNGHVSPDSFRLYEALELGCVPIVRDDPFWFQLFGASPIVKKQPDDDWADILKWTIESYDLVQQTMFDWWEKKKQLIKEEILNA